jgi:hypothetical protein
MLKAVRSIIYHRINNQHSSLSFGRNCTHDLLKKNCRAQAVIQWTDKFR